MKKTILFAIDLNTEEIIVSESQKGSNKVNLIERIHRNKNELLFDAVVTLTRITNSPNFDMAIFKAMDKVCEMIYMKHIENK
jgi:protease II